MTDGYIYVKNWKKFQHPDAVRSRHMPWLKLHTDLLGNDKWLALDATDRIMLQTIWMLTARYGHGRVIADLRWLQGQAKLPLSNRYQGLERLSEAGFIDIRASKSARKAARKDASLDKDVEGSKEPKKRPRASASKPQAAAAARDEKKPAWEGANEGLAQLSTVFERKGDDGESEAA